MLQHTAEAFAFAQHFGGGDDALAVNVSRRRSPVLSWGDGVKEITGSFVTSPTASSDGF